MLLLFHGRVVTTDQALELFWKAERQQRITSNSEETTRFSVKG